MIRRLSLLSLLIVGAACADTGTDEDGNSRGDLRVNVTTTGASLDPNGYDIFIDLGAPVTIGANTSYLFEGLLSGPHTMAISGIASNCNLTGANPRNVGVVTNQETPVAIAVTCADVTPAPDRLRSRCLRPLNPPEITLMDTQVRNPQAIIHVVATGC